MEPKLYVILIGVILGTFIFPIVREVLKESKSRKNLMRMLGEDIHDRMEDLQTFADSFTVAIKKMEADSDYTLCLFNTEGIPDYIDWNSDKWLIPEYLTKQIFHYYNHRYSIISIIEFAGTDAFKNLSRDRQINLYNRLLTEVETTKNSGAEVYRLLDTGGWIK